MVATGLKGSAIPRASHLLQDVVAIANHRFCGVARAWPARRRWTRRGGKSGTHQGSADGSGSRKGIHLRDRALIGDTGSKASAVVGPVDPAGKPPATRKAWPPGEISDQAEECHTYGRSSYPPRC
jgi:hypothetical protein